MIFCAHHLLEELYANNIIRNFKSFPKNRKDLKFKLISNGNPRNNIIQISHAKNKFIFKQPRVYTLINIDTFENEVQFYTHFKKKNVDFIYEKEKKYLILEGYDALNISNYKFFENKSIIQKNLNSFLEKSRNVFYSFNSETSNRSKRNNFLKNTSLDIEPYYSFLLKKYNTATIRNQFDVIFFNDDCSNERKKVRALVLAFLKCKSTQKYFKNLQNNNIFQNDNLIHGDFEIRNILQNKKFEFQIIDFEFVCKGDIVWDLVCFLESLMLVKFDLKYPEIFKIRFDIIITFIKQVFCQKLTEDIFERFVHFVIIYRIRFLLEDSNPYAKSYKRNAQILNSLNYCIFNINRIVKLLKDETYHQDLNIFLFPEAINN